MGTKELSSSLLYTLYSVYRREEDNSLVPMPLLQHFTGSV